MRNTLIGVLAAAAALGAGTAQAQFAKPEDAIKFRQSALTVMATYFGRIGAVAKGAVPYDAAAVQSNAAIVEQMDATTVVLPGMLARVDALHNLILEHA